MKPEPALKVKVLLPGGMPDAFWYDAGNFPPEAIGIGSIVRVPLGAKKKAAGVVVETGNPELDFRTKPIEASAPEGAKVPLAWIGMIRWISEYYLMPQPQVLATCMPKAAWDYLFAPPKRTRARKTVSAAPTQEESLPLRPTAEQEAAISAVGEYLDPPRFRPFLLHGITGSGKTLVYLHLAKRALEAGKRVLVLLPEIALTPQTIARFRAYLGRPVLAFHSELSASEKRELWQELFAGRADIIVGARSAVLCPIDNLGLIMVDEEHDGSYKQSRSYARADVSPRYNARDLALYRGRQAECPVVLGSATPSLESYHAAQTGKYRLLELKTRATGSAAPQVEVVDMREQFELQGNLPLSIPLREGLQRILEAGEQAILFLNRRGYAPRSLCRSCGEMRQCPRCAVPLVFHKQDRALKCHYCGFSLPAEAACAACGSGEFLETGRGIEKVEEYLKEIFPAAGVERLDQDSTASIGGAEKILARFRKGEFRILIGTQMVAKGHDFPGVNLAAVLDADAGLGFADFRAQERAFQLVTQVAGRAGRHQGAGKVYLQTFRPDNPLLQFALAHDYAGFYRAEIGRREELEYPPFRRLLLAEISGSDEALVERRMETFGDAFRHFAAQAGVLVLGPAFAARRKINGQYRSQIVGKGKGSGALQWTLRESLRHYQSALGGPPKRDKIRIWVDMDPQELL